MCELEYFLSVENIEISLLCPSTTVASTFKPRQYLQSLEISKQISCVLSGIDRAISRKKNWSKFLTAGYLVASVVDKAPN